RAALLKGDEDAAERGDHALGEPSGAVRLGGVEGAEPGPGGGQHDVDVALHVVDGGLGGGLHLVEPGAGDVADRGETSTDLDGNRLNRLAHADDGLADEALDLPEVVLGALGEAAVGV